VLLTAGSLVARSSVEAPRTDPGFDPAGVVNFRVNLPSTQETRIASAYDMAAVVSSLPGTTRVAFSFESPLGGGFAAKHSTGTEILATDPMIPIRLVSSGFLEALSARVTRGRLLEEADIRSEGLVAVLNESAARIFFRDADPVGRTVRSGFGGQLLTVVGVVRDMRTSGLDRPSGPVLYRPYMPYFGSDMVFSVRTSEPFDRFVPALRARLRVWNPVAVLVGVFAILGLIIGCFGLYGTFSADLTRSTRELGIRLALGASARSVLARVLTREARVVMAGVAVGLGGSVAAAASLSPERAE
jgi:putative ABC transport system permease protein